MDLAAYLKMRVEYMKRDIAYLRTERAKARLGMDRWAYEMEHAQQELSRLFRDFDRLCTVSICEPGTVGPESKDMAS